MGRLLAIDSVSHIPAFARTFLPPSGAVLIFLRPRIGEWHYMSTEAELPSALSTAAGEQTGVETFDPISYEVRTSDGLPDGCEATWKVQISPHGELIRRDVWIGAQPWDPAKEGWESEGIIWPTWPNRLEDEAAMRRSPLDEAHDYWTNAANRLRDSAKWMATVLGAALAAVVGTSPLAHLEGHRLTWISVTLGVCGLLLLGITLCLVLQVMRPQPVSFIDVQTRSGGPLEKWRAVVESQHDMYLPCGIVSLTSLRQSLVIEQVTLQALARARATTQDETESRRLGDAQTARTVRLIELRGAAGRIAAIGEYYMLRARTTRDTYIGVTLALAGTTSIVGAFLWPIQ